MEVHNRVSFIFVAFVVVKLKNLKCFRGDGASMKWPIFDRFWALTPLYMVWFCWNLHQSYSSRRVRHCFKNFLKIQIFPEIGRTQNLPFFQFLSNFESVFSPWSRAKSKKLNIFRGKTMPSGYPKIAKWRPYLVPIFQEKYDYFLSHFGSFLVKKGAWSHFKGSESKSHLPYCSLILGQFWGMFQDKKFGSATSQFCGYRCQRSFFLILDDFFRFGCFSRYHTPNLEKSEFDFLVLNLILNSLVQFLNPNCERQRSSCGNFFLPCFHFWRF